MNALAAMMPIVTVTLLGLPAPAALAAAPADPPAGPGAMAPNLTGSGDEIHLTWLEPSVPGAGGDRDALRLRLSAFAGGTWTAPVTIVEGRDFFANWADVPSIAAAGDGTLVAHWLQRSGPDTYAYDVMLARSADGGRTWRAIGAAHDDGTPTEHGFVSLVGESGAVRAFWLDGREMAHDLVEKGLASGMMTLRTALVGESVGESVLLDDRVCECCATSAVMTAAGPFVVYRDRSQDEVRDVAAVRLVDGRWTEPATVHEDGWLIAGCPVNGPAADSDGRLAVVAWFTGASQQGAVRAAFSTDAGERFGDPVTLDDTWPLGRVDVALSGPAEAVVCWLDTVEGGVAILLRRAAADGRLAVPVTVAPSSAARAAGFPQLARTEEGFLVVWTQESTTTHLRGMLLADGDVPGVAEAPEARTP